MISEEPRLLCKGSCREATEGLPLSEQLKQIKYLYVEKSDMEKTFIITYTQPSPVGEGGCRRQTDEVSRQIKIKAPSKYRAKQIFYLVYPKYQILRIEEKTENV